MLKIDYTPDIGITIGEVALSWGNKREDVRKLMGNCHKAQDLIYDFTDIPLNRDIYETYKSSGSFFFLNYKDGNLLNEMEVQEGVEITVGSARLSFEREFSNALADLKMISPSVVLIGYEKCFFKDLILTISSNKAMGGNDNDLGYFYCSTNVDHLIE